MEIGRIVNEFVEARQSGKPIDVLHNREELDLNLAYEVQSSFVDRWTTDERRSHAGYKISLTNSADQARLNALEPASGVVFTDSLLDSGALVSSSVGVLVEPEIVFIVTKPAVSSLTDIELANRVDIAPAIELPTSRYKDWLPLENIVVTDLVADNAAGGWVVVGPQIPAASIDMPKVKVNLARDGQTIATGESRNVLGNPFNSLRWLLRRLESRGDTLPTGAIVSSGTLTKPANASAGTFTASFSQIGSVRVVFAE